MQEEWKGLVYKDVDLSYKMEISNFGNLRNVKTKKLYSQYQHKHGYMLHCTSLGSRNSKRLIRIHIAVALMFIENPDNKPQVNHIDGNKTNNNTSNLEWVTGSENVKHAWGSGLITKDMMNSANQKKTRLTDEDVVFILTNYSPRHKTFGCRALGVKFNINHDSISNIVNNNSHKWISRDDIKNPNIIK